MPSPTSSAIRSVISAGIFLLALFFCWRLPAMAAYDFKTESGLQSFASDIGYDTEDTDINQKISSTLNILYSFLGVIFIVLIIYGGVLWMTDQGNAKHKEKAKQVITEAIAGLVIVVAAYAITRFVFTYLRGGELTPQNEVIQQEQGNGNDYQTEDYYLENGY